MNNGELTFPTHTRAQAVRKLAEARAQARVADAEARLQALIEEGGQRLQESARRQAASALEPSRLRMEQAAKATILERLPLTDEFKEAVSIRAYFKAEQRGFEVGGEGHDWAEAERDVLEVEPFGGRT